jgi:hypothetical protein
MQSSVQFPACALTLPFLIRYQPLALAGLSITKLLVEALRLPKRGARALRRRLCRLLHVHLAHRWSVPCCNQVDI